MRRHLDAAGRLTSATQEIGPCLEREVLDLGTRADPAEPGRAEGAGPLAPVVNPA